MATTNWALDTTHSEINFKIRHMMISSVSGHFGSFDAQVSSEGDDFTKASIRFTADVNSITTKNEQRDGHLKSADFFDAENHPQIVFVGKKMTQKDDNEYELTGDLTIRDVTKEVKLDVDFGGFMKDPWGNERAGFEVEGKINRKDFGLSWHAVTEAGGIVVADEVKIHCAVEFIKQATA